MARIKCGKCKGIHRSVLAVRICYDNDGVDLIMCEECSWGDDRSITFHTPDQMAWEMEAREAQQEAEILAEQRQERWYEEHGGSWEPDYY